jgi:hypothetical protein
MTQTHNPLRQFFRQPAIYLKLPSAGNWWPEGSLQLPENGELPIYPMTAIDEITYRTPDALFNGQAVVNVVQSCVPAIKNAWHTPSVDLNALLVAIRIASFGHEMEISAVCPSCSHEEDYSLDLRSTLDQMRTPDYNKNIQHADLEIFFKPMDYQQQNASAMAQFAQQKTLSLLNSSDMTEEQKVDQLKQALKTITDLTIEVVVKSIAAIKTPSAVVVDPVQIEEFFRSCDRKVYTQLRDHVVQLNQDAQLQSLKIKCTECSHDYEHPMNLDMTSFFESAS